MKYKKGITITNAFQKNLKESNHKRKKIRVDKGSQCFNRSMKSFLQNSTIEICSTYKKGKSVIAEKFMRTLKNKTFKYKTSISKMFILIN